MMRTGRIQAGAIIVVALFAVVPAAASTRVDRAIAAAVGEITAAHPEVRCTGEASPPGFSCLQAGRDGRNHFAALSVTGRPAVRRRPTAAAIDSSLFGPGGGSSRFIGQTHDHRFDIVVTAASSLGDGDPDLLPAAPALIDRVATLYRSTRR